MNLITLDNHDVAGYFKLKHQDNFQKIAFNLEVPKEHMGHKKHIYLKTNKSFYKFLELTEENAFRYKKDKFLFRGDIFYDGDISFDSMDINANQCDIYEDITDKVKVDYNKEPKTLETTYIKKTESFKSKSMEHSEFNNKKIDLYEEPVFCNYPKLFNCLQKNATSVSKKNTTKGSVVMFTVEPNKLDTIDVEEAFQHTIKTAFAFFSNILVSAKNISITLELKNHLELVQIIIGIPCNQHININMLNNQTKCIMRDDGDFMLFYSIPIK